MSLQQHKGQNVLREKNPTTALVLLCLLSKKLGFSDVSRDMRILQILKNHPVK